MTRNLVTQLVPSTDAHFAWMLGEAGPPDALRLPPGGVDEAWVLKWLRKTLPTLGGRGGYLVTDGAEIVGLCGYKDPPDAEGKVEIGYGVAAEHRRRGHATSALGALIAEARGDRRVRRLTAETALANKPSQRVLIRNGFEPTGRGHDADEGEMIIWTLELDR